tara:strand:+ start:5511 stop:6980 length:1470 start_codon:yes stop_codon:yes gene_type:complete
MLLDEFSLKELTRMSLQLGEANESGGGALVTATGDCTGRSPKAKSIVCDSITQGKINWDANQSITHHEFLYTRDRMKEHLAKAGETGIYTQTLYANRDPANTLRLKVNTTLLWHSIFARNMFVRPELIEHMLTGQEDEWTIYAAPTFTSDPMVLISFQEQEILISGTYYAGEIKKSVFTVLNFLLPAKGILPMHCSVNTAEDGGAPAIFFGLSGTGKTTLSSEEDRVLIGDDEHSWSDTGLYNFEGGCYAKVIRLDAKAEPQIWNACQRHGAILENVILHDDRTPDFNDATLTENTRASYPIEYISNSSKTGAAGHPANVVMLTCDAFGILPPVSKLTPEEAVQHFLLGYTAKVAGTEAGVKEPEATFSYCYGAPFMPRFPQEYAHLLKGKIEKHKVDCWLVNTGWTGGGYGIGHRMPIDVTRKIIAGIHDGTLKKADYQLHPYTGLKIPVKFNGIDESMLSPDKSWANLAEYEEQAEKLMKEFKRRSE